MKSPQTPFAVFALVLAAAVLASSTAAQAPQSPQGKAADQSSAPPPRSFPAPTNLKVLPKDLTGQQVRDIMKQWSASLGSRCDSCHAEDPDNVRPDGRPILKFADDSKPMKAVARTMYTMTEQINSNYIARLEGSGLPVTCGTCHRGHIGPEPFDASSQSQKPPMPAPPDQNRPASQ
ncbi:MAG: c-type cytochrome [Acidobacteriota bacterium]|nr:c-type cytochrome [Acidobacteriota bacterium]